MIKVSNLTKKYGRKTVLDNISFDVNDGEVLGFLGPNGAGKSTTMNIITGCLAPTKGTVTIDGHDITEDSTEAKKLIGYLPEIPPVYVDMTVLEYLDFVYDLKKAQSKKKEDHILSVLKSVRIENVQKRKIGNLSKGYRQRVGLAASLIGDPKVLILDEPTVGLDPKQIIEVRNIIKTLGKTKTVILSSHILSEISAVADRVFIINKGKFIVEDTAENLAGKVYKSKRMTFETEGDKEKAEEILSSYDTVTNIKCEEKGENVYVFSFDTSLTAAERKKIFFDFAQNGIAILNQHEEEISLEDIFLKIIDKEDK